MEKLRIEEVFKNYHLKKNDIEIVISELRRNNLSQMKSTLILMDKLKISLQEADSYIVNSKTWSDRLENLIKLRENIFDQAQSLIKEKDEKKIDNENCKCSSANSPSSAKSSK